MDRVSGPAKVSATRISPRPGMARARNPNAERLLSEGMGLISGDLRYEAPQPGCSALENRRPQRALPYLFVLFALPVCLLLAVLVPTGEVPDEAAHVLRADSLLHGEVLGQRRVVRDPEGTRVQTAGVMANLALLLASATFNPGAPIATKIVDRQVEHRVESIEWAPRLGFAELPNTAVYMPLFYVPFAVALGAGHVFGLHPHAAILAGRLANAVTYVALGALALLIAHAGQRLMFATLLLPMSLWLAASANEDGLILACAALGAALLTQKSRQRLSYCAAGACIAAIGAAKPPYLPLAVAMFYSLPLRHLQIRQVIRRLIATAAVILPGLAWSIIAITMVAVSFPRQPYAPGPLWPGDPSVIFHATDAHAQLRVLLDSPVRFFTLPLATLSANLHWTSRELVGILGLLSIVLPSWLYSGWFWALGAAAIADILVARRERPASGLGSPLLLLGVFASVWAVYLTQYLSWSSVGEAEIGGVQGRYFLPLLPFLAIALPPVRVMAAGPLRRLLTVPVIALALAGMAIVPSLVVTTYYLH